MLQLIKEAGCYNGITARDDFPVTEVLNQVCPSTWRGACKTAVQLLFGQAGLVSSCVRQMKRAQRCFKKVVMSPGSGAHSCNPSSAGGRDQEDLGLKPAWANSS
jgi:hypothetical protein